MALTLLVFVGLVASDGISTRRSRARARRADARLASLYGADHPDADHAHLRGLADPNPANRAPPPAGARGRPGSVDHAAGPDAEAIPAYDEVDAAWNLPPRGLVVRRDPDRNPRLHQLQRQQERRERARLAQLEEQEAELARRRRQQQGQQQGQRDGQRDGGVAGLPPPPSYDDVAAAGRGGVAARTGSGGGNRGRRIFGRLRGRWRGESAVTAAA